MRPIEETCRHRVLGGFLLARAGNLGPRKAIESSWRPRYTAASAGFTGDPKATIGGKSMHSYAIAEWKDFFVAISGAAAALAGLLFVALSINLARILEMPGMPDRAGETLLLLGSALVSGLLGLVPQPPRAFGFELLFIACSVWCLTTYFAIRSLRRHFYDTTLHAVQRVTFAQAATVPLIVAAASFLLGAGRGMYWLVPGLILPLLVSMLNAWVLLVEILR